MTATANATSPGPGLTPPAALRPRAVTVLESALELVRKYDVPGPRYTSYPTAPHFSATCDRQSLLAEIAEDNKDAALPLSLYVHIPFCESLCWYCGCNTVITGKKGAVKQGVAHDYVTLLIQELEQTAKLLNRARPVTQLHFGGGTPTFLPPEEIDRLAATLKSLFTFAPDAEISVEIDPRRLTQQQVLAFRRLGCNRASLGVQDTDVAVQKAIHRLQPISLTAQAVTWLREAGYQSVAIDLIYGLPLQTVDSFSRTTQEVLKLNPDRFAIFSYAHVPWLKPAQKVFDVKKQLPEASEKLSMLVAAARILTEAGYAQIGMDHFARPSDELAQAHAAGTLHRNFQGYTTRAGASLYGFGMTSISQTGASFRQNEKELEAWAAKVRAGELPIERGLVITDEDQRRRTLVMDVMCKRRLDYQDLSARTGVDVAKNYAAEFASLGDLEKDGLLVRDAAGLTITPLGELFRRIIAMRFDAYLGSGPRNFSRAV
jgi:oxygen-independent coproporphyrinogen-3 oxidase